MKLRGATNKAKKGLSVIKNDGIIDFTIKTLQFVKKKQSQKTKESHQRHKLSLIVKYEDLVKTDISRPYPAWKGTSKKKFKLNWVMPPPGKGSGGHINIFRFIKFAEEAGHECRIYLYADGGYAPMSAIEEQMGESYPETAAVKTMQWLNIGDEMADAEAIFATSWETAYVVYNSTLKAKRFYFVQDFEPYFFPAGSIHSLAENTYRFGFYGVTAGGWLAKKLNRDYGMATGYFNFGADKETYHVTNGGVRKEVFFYARPYTARRGFEMGVVALDLFHKQHPSYTINLVGWDVSDYDIPFPYKNLKTLEIDELNDLYNRCAAGLVMSFSNMSLLPLEMLASGTIPVVNDGENNRLVSDNKYIAYSHSDPVSLAKELSRVVSMDDLPRYSREASASVAGDLWQQSGEKFVKIIEREVQKR